jgi:hypothetical protein
MVAQDGMVTNRKSIVASLQAKISGGNVYRVGHVVKAIHLIAVFMRQALARFLPYYAQQAANLH